MNGEVDEEDWRSRWVDREGGVGWVDEEGDWGMEKSVT